MENVRNFLNPEAEPNERVRFMETDAMRVRLTLPNRYRLIKIKQVIYRYELSKTVTWVDYFSTEGLYVLGAIQ